MRGIPFNLSSQEDIILPVTGSPSYFVGVDFSAEDDAIFFSDTTKDIIYKQKVDGTGEHLFSVFPVLTALDYFFARRKLFHVIQSSLNRKLRDS